MSREGSMYLADSLVKTPFAFIPDHMEANGLCYTSILFLISSGWL